MTDTNDEEITAIGPDYSRPTWIALNILGAIVIGFVNFVSFIKNPLQFFKKKTQPTLGK